MRAARARVHGGIGGWRCACEEGGVAARHLGLAGNCVAEVGEMAVAYALPFALPMLRVGIAAHHLAA